MDSAHYDQLDGEIRGLLVDLDVLESDHVREIEEYLDAREYGLALETLVDILVEERLEVTSDVGDRIGAVADRMGTGDEIRPRLVDIVRS